MKTMSGFPQTPPAPGSSADELMEAAKRRATELQGFFIHVIVYVVINGGLFAINAITRGAEGTWWFYWPLMGWGIGLLIHAAVIYIGVFSEDWRDRKAREIVERARRRAV
jgi:hypothetical protein